MILAIMHQYAQEIRHSTDERLAAVAMRFYRSCGWNPLPSRTDKKAPCCPYAEFWESPAPHRIYTQHRTSNVQVMTGAHWNLAVIDLDGPVAIEAWRSMAMFQATPSTWQVVNDPAKGLHLWFRLPAGLDSCPSRFVWRLDNAEHANIELIGDRRLIMAPPSIHPTTGKRYRWVDGHSPDELAQPAIMPDWILGLPGVVERADMSAPISKAKPYEGPAPKGSYDFDAVIDAIPDKAALARSWGLRLASNGPNRKGWWQAHAIDREDRTPSAGMHESSGIYFDLRERKRLSLFALAVAFGVYRTISEACNHLGQTYGAISRT